MSRGVEVLCSRRSPQAAVLALISVGFAGCSADTQTRFSQSSSNPFSAPQVEATGSVAQPAPQVEQRETAQQARPQPQYQSSELPPPVAAPQTYPAGVSGGGRGIASYSPPTHKPIETTGTVAPRSIAAKGGAQGGGTTIIVGTSDTLEGLSHRYGVSTADIMRACGYKGPRALQPAQQLIITPRAVAAAPAAPAPPAAPAKPVVAAGPAAPVAAAPSVHV